MEINDLSLIAHYFWELNFWFESMRFIFRVTYISVLQVAEREHERVWIRLETFFGDLLGDED